MGFDYSVNRRSWYSLLFIFSAAVCILTYVWIEEAWKVENIKSELIFSVLGSVAAFFHFLYGQHNSDTQRFIELFKDFNKRYDRINSSLNKIYEKPQSEGLTSDERQILYDYFNLCAEEYLFFNGQYIDRNVWNAWKKGMAYFAGNPVIRRLWEEEIKQGSYYGFDLSQLQNL